MASALHHIGVALAGLGVVLLAGVACVLSFDDLRELAISGRAAPGLAYLYPAGFDALLAVALISMLLLWSGRFLARLQAAFVLIVLIAAAAWANLSNALRLVVDERVATIVVAVAPWAMVAIALWLWFLVIAHARSRRVSRDRSPHETGSDLVPFAASPERRHTDEVEFHPIDERRDTRDLPDDTRRERTERTDRFDDAYDGGHASDEHKPDEHKPDERRPNEQAPDERAFIVSAVAATEELPVLRKADSPPPEHTPAAQDTSAETPPAMPDTTSPAPEHTTVTQDTPPEDTTSPRAPHTPPEPAPPMTDPDDRDTAPHAVLDLPQPTPVTSGKPEADTAQEDTPAKPKAETAQEDKPGDKSETPPERRPQRPLRWGDLVRPNPGDVLVHPRPEDPTPPQEITDRDSPTQPVRAPRTATPAADTPKPPQKATRKPRQGAQGAGKPASAARSSASKSRVKPATSPDEDTEPHPVVSEKAPKPRTRAPKAQETASEPSEPVSGERDDTGDTMPMSPPSGRMRSTPRPPETDSAPAKE
ncbi:DUF2637 domain-containing protein [Sinosporangium siamense]|uniref:DUF2637 domain-containing protein n=1 Tax=Sinosporangium siamense TaxID=1367973 RepID=UPI00194DE5E6|nr:DUF2637 domain-containing protein [Sinosporangium siamense]